MSNSIDSGSRSGMSFNILTKKPFDCDKSQLKQLPAIIDDKE